MRTAYYFSPANQGDDTMDSDAVPNVGQTWASAKS